MTPLPPRPFQNVVACTVGIKMTTTYTRVVDDELMNDPESKLYLDRQIFNTYVSCKHPANQERSPPPPALTPNSLNFARRVQPAEASHHRPSNTFITSDDCDYDAPGKAATARTQETPHSNGVVGQSSSYGGSNQVSGQAGGGGPARRKIAYSDGSSSSVAEGAEEGGPEKTKGERQQQQQEHRPRLLRSNSDRAILGRVDYNAVKRDLR